MTSHRKVSGQVKAVWKAAWQAVGKKVPTSAPTALMPATTLSLSSPNPRRRPCLALPHGKLNDARDAGRDMGSLDSGLAHVPVVTPMHCSLYRILLAVLALVHGLVASQGSAGQGQPYPGNEGRVATGSLPRCLPRAILTQVPRPWPCVWRGPPAFALVSRGRNLFVAGFACIREARRPVWSAPKMIFSLTFSLFSSS